MNILARREAVVPIMSNMKREKSDYIVLQVGCVRLSEFGQKLATKSDMIS